MFLFTTWDNIGSETGGGIVTKHELEALQQLGTTDIINPPMTSDPFSSDDYALKHYTNKSYKLAHFYSGTYSKFIDQLKSYNVKITYTAAAHDVELSKNEFEKFGLVYDFPHLTNPKLFEQYIRGFKEADLVICPSNHSKEIMEKFGCERIKVIPHGCNPPQQVKDPGYFSVGYLGSPGTDKGLFYLIQAWSLLNYDDVQLTIAGRRTEEVVLDLVRAFGKGSIHLAGFVEHTSILYNNCAVYIQPSVTEGFGIEVIEAMSYGRPVICSDGAGAADCITHNVDGLIVPKRNSEALAEAIDFYKKNPDKVSEHGKAAKEKSKLYYWDRIVEKYRDVFLTI